MQLILGDKREIYLLDESVLPVTEKERRREGKSIIGPRMKYVNLSFVPQNERKKSKVEQFLANFLFSVSYNFF